MKPFKEWIALMVSVLALMAAIGGPYMAWGATQARLEEVEKKADVSVIDSKLLAEHKAIIPTIQQDIRDLKDSIKEQRMDVKEILRLVKS